MFFKSISKRLVDLLSFFSGEKHGKGGVFLSFFWGGVGGWVEGRIGWGVLI